MGCFARKHVITLWAGFQNPSSFKFLGTQKFDTFRRKDVAELRECHYCFLNLISLHSKEAISLFFVISHENWFLSDKFPFGELVAITLNLMSSNWIWLTIACIRFASRWSGMLTRSGVWRTREIVWLPNSRKTTKFSRRSWLQQKLLPKSSLDGSAKSVDFDFSWNLIRLFESVFFSFLFNFIQYI